MSEGFVLIGNTVGLRRQHQSGYPVAFLPDGVEYSGKPFRITRERVRQDFDRDVALQPRIARAIHLAHAARAERRNDLVRT